MIDKQDFDEICERLLARHAPESPAGQALVFAKQVLTAETLDESADALFWLIHLLTTVSERERFRTMICAKMLAFACTERGDAFFEALAEKYGPED